MTASLTWLGHSTMKLTLADGRVIYVDPWLHENPMCPPFEHEPKRCDLILLTHGHFDHMAGVPTLVKRFNAPVVANYDLCDAMKHHVTPADYRPMNTGGTQDVGGVKITLTRAYHSSAIDAGRGPIYAGMPNGLIIDAPGLAKLYHTGDTDVFGDMALIARLHRPKVALLPIGDLFTMGAKGAALAAEFIQPEAIIPIHYLTFPILAQSADEFRAALPEGLKSRLITPRPGEALAWNERGVLPA